MMLAHAAPLVCIDPVKSKNRSNAQLRKDIYKLFCKDSLKPGDAGTYDKEGGPRDSRRWQCRNPDTCWKMWERMRHDCTTLKAIKERHISLHLTGSVTDQEYKYCATYELEDGGQNKKIL